MTDDASELTSDRSWWRDSWPNLLVVLLATGSFGLIGGIVISGIVWWLGRWRRVQIVAFWLLIPCLLVTFMVAKSTQKQRAHEWVMAEFAPSNHPSANAQPAATPVEKSANSNQPNIYERMDLRPVAAAAPNGPPAPNVFDQFDPKPTARAWNTLTPDPSRAAVDAENSHWTADLETFYTQHPVVLYQQNAKIVVEKMRALPYADLTHFQIMDNALDAARGDSRWKVPPGGEQPFDQAAEDARWKDDVAMLFQQHPALRLQHNPNIFQEHLKAVAIPGMTNQQMLDKAYAETVNDRRWASVP